MKKSNAIRVLAAVGMFLLFEPCGHQASGQGVDVASQLQIDLSHWKLTLPRDSSGGTAGKAAEVSSSQLVAGYRDEYFTINADQSIVFWCPVNGATTEGTEFPRSELREMLDSKTSKTNWSAQGTHVLRATCRVEQLPSTLKVIIGQIHSYSGKAKPLIKLQYNKDRVEALVKESPNKGNDRKLTFAKVGLNTRIHYEIELEDGLLSVTVNGDTQVVDIAASDPEWMEQTFYFKAGAYVQDNDGPSSEGSKVVFSKLETTHSATPLPRDSTQADQ